MTIARLPQPEFQDFEWDEVKNQANIAKHGIDFNHAKGIFDRYVHPRDDDRIDYGEVRTIAYGMVDNDILTVVFTIRGDTLRIISARSARRDERRTYRTAEAGR